MCCVLAQRQAFTAQLELAIELQRPISFHCVRAFGHVMDLFRDYAHTYDQLVLHLHPALLLLDPLHVR
jgi:Tat protein secretion system quality control protein TatD with DNase activity